MHFASDYEEFIFKSRYARWLDDKARREHLPETVDRYMSFMAGHLSEEHNFVMDEKLFDRLTKAITSFESMPSMRAMMTAGEALHRDNTAGYNCAYLVTDAREAFDEAMFILLCGTGVGFSVERRYVRQLPIIPRQLYQSDTTIVVQDSKEGWAKAQRQLITLLYAGEVPRWDTSLVRKAGTRLKTFGGRASGPEPLEDLFRFTVNTFQRFKGERLPSIACHDLMCKTGEVVVVGGVRRSAMISLSDLDDEHMANAKGFLPVVEYMLLDKKEDGTKKYSVTVLDGPYGNRSLILEIDNDRDDQKLQCENLIAWYHVHPERRLANNSAVYEELPSAETFLTEWTALVKSKAGERGIFSRKAALELIKGAGRRRFEGIEFGCNPCSEILLRPYQFCNLTEAVARAGDTLEDLMKKVENAVILGTFQSTLTKFPYLRDIWRRNTEEERLLGVSLTGIMDHEVLSGHDDLPFWLNKLREHAIAVNAIWAKKLGINQSVAITCVKPSGTVSQLVNSASGIHARHSQFYIRTVRGDNKDPMTRFMAEMGIPAEPDMMKPESTTIFSFPIAAPDGCITRNDRTALEELELWTIYQKNWCEHKPSCTVSVRDHEWMKVGAWVYDNFDVLSGISFFPHYDANYDQAPYQEITREEYEAAVALMPEKIDWSKFEAYEVEDNTVGSQTMACSGGACELVDLVS